MIIFGIHFRVEREREQFNVSSPIYYPTCVLFSDMAHMYNRVVSCITKPPAGRTEEEITALLPWFSKKSKLFEGVKSIGELIYLISLVYTVLRLYKHHTLNGTQ